MRNSFYRTWIVAREKHVFIGLLLTLQIAGCGGGPSVPGGPGQAGTTAGAASTTQAVPRFDASAVGEDVILLGRCHEPLGHVMTLTGIVVEGPFKGYEGGPNMVVQRIDGIATQEFIRLPLLGSTFDQDKPRNPGYRDALLYVADKTYELRGFETGVFVGTPPGANDGISIQTTGYHMETDFEPTFAAKPRMVDPIIFAPTDFLNRRALLSGTAANVNGRGYLVGGNWRLLSADDGSVWPDWMVGKLAEVDGLIRARADRDFRAEHAARRLIQLADQVGHQVELHGLVGDGYEEGANQCVLHYRGELILIRHLAACPSWSDRQEWKPVAIHGTLTAKAATEPDDKIKWSINDPAWAPLPALRSTEISDTSPW
jgi:hypothetical protein